MVKLSIVIPTYNEEKNPYFTKILNELSDIPDTEVIFCDGGSSDATKEMIQKHSYRLHEDKTMSRAQRMNNGVKLATGEMILFHHPRSFVTRESLLDFIQNRGKIRWGGFTHQFDQPHHLLKFTSWYSNNVRGKISGILYLDHCIFMQREIAQKVFPIPAIDIFEDTILSKKLKSFAGHPTIMPYISVTASIRFTKNGIWKQGISNQILKIKYHLGMDLNKMNKDYEKNTSLNSDYNQ